jgi:serine protease
MNIRIIATLLFALTYVVSTFSQQLHRVQGEVLVMLEEKTDIRAWAWQFREFDGQKSGFDVNKLVSGPMNIWSFTFDHTVVSEYKILKVIRRQQEVKLAQFNHLTEMRSTVPNDTEFNNQWQYINTGQGGGLPGADIDADLAWDITTGGLTAFGDTIVVCVIDGGIDLNHQDFEDNRWINYQEIPDNGIDDDENGYVDDYLGWVPALENDDIAGTNHGTAVAGIVGAQGNNGLGVTGVSWNVKVMIVRRNISASESNVLEAYTYALVQRRLYNETNGEKGAFVVATNASWGQNFGHPEDYPLWCAMYDTLGNAGILNCGATANLDINVEEEGDMPTNCTSDYLIGVTNLNRFDQKVTNAAYGPISIDLGAYGADTWTTSIGNSYNGFSGTSGATPHVTGTIGLLYAVPCEGFISLAKTAPAAAALLMKQVILSGVTPNESLDTITVTGGRLNIYNSLTLLMENCEGCFPPVTLSATNINVSTTDIHWAQSDSILRVDARWRAIGETDWMIAEEVDLPFQLADLTVCTDYELQLRGYCQNDTLDYTESLFFRTEGCCEPPEDIQITQVTDNSVTMDWEDILTANGYVIEYRENGDQIWFTTQAFSSEVFLSSLNNCTEYEFRIRTFCGEDGENGEIHTFMTTGCGACVDTPYCIPENLAGNIEWIDEFSLGELVNESGMNNSYGDFTLMESVVLLQGQSYEMSITPAYDGFAYSEDVHIYIDYNHNGEFEEEELLFELEETINSNYSTTIQIPEDAPPGLTRLRVVMQFQSVDGPCPGGVQEYGEVEDYCTVIDMPDNIRDFEVLDFWNTYPNPFNQQLLIDLELKAALEVLLVNITDPAGRIVFSQQKQKIASGKQIIDLNLEQLPPGLYYINISDKNGNFATRKIVKMD